MGLKINQSLNLKGGGTITSGAVIAPTVKFHRAQYTEDEDGNPADPIRPLEFELFVNKDKATFQANKDNIVTGEFVEIPLYWIKYLTPEEYTLLSDPTINTLALVQTWLKDHLVSLGVTAVLEDLMT